MNVMRNTYSIVCCSQQLGKDPMQFASPAASGKNKEIKSGGSTSTSLNYVSVVMKKAVQIFSPFVLQNSCFELEGGL